MISRHLLCIVTGAPGSGKSIALQAFVARHSRYVVFDIDWLLAPASALSGKDISVDASSWPLYNALWLEVLHGVNKNNLVPVLFAPLDKTDLPTGLLPAWCRGIEWLLLDCSNETRRARLTARSGWTDEMVEEALKDARVLRETVPRRIDTDDRAPDSVALLILEWLNHMNGQK